MARKKQDWPHERIRAALNAQGLKYSDVERIHKITARSACDAATYPNAKAEKAIADCLGLAPDVIWPSRYAPNGERLRPQPEENYWKRIKFPKREAA